MARSSDEGVVVRRVHPEEWEAYRALRLRALARDRVAFGSSFEDEARRSDSEWKEKADRGANSPTSYLCVAEVPDDKLVGMAVGALVEGTPWIFGMWVEPTWRGRGIGGALLDSAISWLQKQRPTQPIFLDVNPRQTAALRLYGSRGFRPTGGSKRLDHSPGESAIQMRAPPATERANA